MSTSLCLCLGLTEGLLRIKPLPCTMVALSPLCSLWNEVQDNDGGVGDADWVIALRAAMDDAGYHNTRIVAADTANWNVINEMSSNPALAAAIDVIGVHYPGGPPSQSQTGWAHSNGKSVWASEMWNLQITNDYAGAMALASDLSRHARYGLSASIVWCLIYSWYPALNYGHFSNTSYGGSGHALLTAAEPWSGYWSVEAPVAVLAQWTQFAKPGWSYLNTSGSGIGILPGGGSYATLVNYDVPAGVTDFSLIIETSASRTNETASFVLKPLAGASLPPSLHVWCTMQSSFFSQQPDVPVDPVSGAFNVSVPAQGVCSLTTTSGQGWVQPPSAPVPSSSPFPFPYNEAFDEGYADGAYARYFSDIGGVWNVATLPVELAQSKIGFAPSEAAPTGTKGYLQSQPSSPINWYLQRTPYPCTVVGNGNPVDGKSPIQGWSDYQVSALVAFDPSIPSTLPQIPVGQRQPCPSASSDPAHSNSASGVSSSSRSGDVLGTTFTLWGGDMGTTPAYLTLVDYPGLCLGVVGQDRNMSHLTYGSQWVGLVNCTAPVAGEDKPIALLHDPANGRLWWNGPANYLCLQSLNSSTSSAEPGRLAMWQCLGNSPNGITSWDVLQLGGGKIALKTRDSGSDCAGAVVAPHPAPPFAFLSVRMGTTGGTTLLPQGYNFLLYKSASPLANAPWELWYGMTLLSNGTAPFPVTPGTFYQLTLKARGKIISALVNGQAITSVTDGQGTYGMVALGSSWHPIWYDDVAIGPLT